MALRPMPLLASRSGVPFLEQAARARKQKHKAKALNPALIRNMTYPTPLSRWRLREREPQEQAGPPSPETNFINPLDGWTSSVGRSVQQWRPRRIRRETWRLDELFVVTRNVNRIEPRPTIFPRLVAEKHDHAAVRCPCRTFI